MAVFTRLTPRPNQLAATAKPPTICPDGDADVGADSSVIPNNTDTDGVDEGLGFGRCGGPGIRIWISTKHALVDLHLEGGRGLGFGFRFGFRTEAMNRGGQRLFLDLQ